MIKYGRNLCRHCNIYDEFCVNVAVTGLGIFLQEFDTELNVITKLDELLQLYSKFDNGSLMSE